MVLGLLGGSGWKWWPMEAPPAGIHPRPVIFGRLADCTVRIPDPFVRAPCPLTPGLEGRPGRSGQPQRDLAGGTPEGRRLRMETTSRWATSPFRYHRTWIESDLLSADALVSGSWSGGGLAQAGEPAGSAFPWPQGLLLSVFWAGWLLSLLCRPPGDSCCCRWRPFCAAWGGWRSIAWGRPSARRRWRATSLVDRRRDLVCDPLRAGRLPGPEDYNYSCSDRVFLQLAVMLFGSRSTAPVCGSRSVRCSSSRSKSSDPAGRVPGSLSAPVPPLIGWPALPEAASRAGVVAEAGLGLCGRRAGPAEGSAWPCSSSASSVPVLPVHRPARPGGTVRSAGRPGVGPAITSSATCVFASGPG